MTCSTAECKSLDRWMKLASDAADDIDRLAAEMQAVKNMVRTLRRTPAEPSNGMNAIQRALDLEVNAVLDMILAGWPTS